VDFDDYALIDLAFSTQNGILLTALERFSLLYSAILQK
jgi:hypothetical protein